MAYTRINWENSPSTATPRNATNLNIMDKGIYDLDTAVSGLLDYFYPVGTIYETTSTDLDTTTKMATHFGGTWEAWGSGRVPVGVDTTQTEFDTVEEVGGAKTVILDITMIPSHTHSLNRNQNASSLGNNNGDIPFTNGATGASAGLTGSTGGGLAHNNLQPYITCYMWKRTA